MGAQISIGGIDLNLKPPSALNWSASIERQLTRSMTASVSYQGSHSYDLVVADGFFGGTNGISDVNIFAGDLLQDPIFNANGNYIGRGALTRLNPNFGSIAYEYNRPRGNYAAVIGAIKGRFNRGFITASYTRSVARDNWLLYPEFLDLD